MDMVNDGVEDLRCKYVSLIYTNYVSAGTGVDTEDEERKGLVSFSPYTTPLLWFWLIPPGAASGSGEGVVGIKSHCRLDTPFCLPAWGRDWSGSRPWQNCARTGDNQPEVVP